MATEKQGEGIGDARCQTSRNAGGCPKMAASFPIVGIGASAGGLAGFEAFFSAVPPDTGIGAAFVLIQHLAPNTKSILTDLIKRYTRMQVFEVEDGMVVQPNCIYVIPPNRDMALLGGTLQLLEPGAKRGLRLPIDYFFRSLAQDQRERAIGIVLSGAGSDGTLGVRAIKGEGGLVIAQSPESAEYDGMPRSAAATGVVDYVLPPAEMPAKLIAYAAHAFGEKPYPLAPVPAGEDEDGMKKIFVLVRARTSHDFSGYKSNTTIRRVKRRMAVHQIERLDEYVRYLQQNPAEVEALFCDFLIGVTSFFRDPDAFAALQEQILPRLFDVASPSALVRVWVPGCSSGEEAYSIAMLLKEQLDLLNESFPVQIFATDIDRRAIEQARAGLYPDSIAADVSPERLRHFFTPADDGFYRVNKGIRDMLIFSVQDVIKDPPFSKLDLLSCRNLLIYMSADLQHKLIPMFHYALNPNGTLFLGTSETVGEFADLFTTLDRKTKLYQRRQGVPPLIQKFRPALTKPTAAVLHAGKTPSEGKARLRELTERTLLKQYGAAGVLVSERGNIVYLHGRTGRYLEPAPGEAGMNIVQMAREGLRMDLAIALRKAADRKEPVHEPGLRVKTNGDSAIVNLTVRPVVEDVASAAAPTLFLVILEEAPNTERLAGAERLERVDLTDADAQIAALKRELGAKEEALRTLSEQLETTIEDLTSSNEEMQSVNEELQSTNEEMETSKEELQSVNEELTTVNSELQERVLELSRTNNDMSNLLAGTGVGTIFLDRQLRIRRFTAPAAAVINLIKTDVGRPIGHLVSNLTNYDNLVADAQAVLGTLAPKEVEVQTKEGEWYLLHVRPYRTNDDKIEGVVVTFVDITRLVKMRESLRRLAVVVRDANDAVTVHDLEGRILAWNSAAERMYGWSEAEALTMRVSDRIPEGREMDQLAVIERLRRREALLPYQTKRIAKNGRVLEISLTVTALVTESGEVYAVATTERELKE